MNPGIELWRGKDLKGALCGNLVRLPPAAWSHGGIYNLCEPILTGHYVQVKGIRPTKFCVETAEDLENRWRQEFIVLKSSSGQAKSSLEAHYCQSGSHRITATDGEDE